MCDVHLIELRRAQTADVAAACSYCNTWIGGPAIIVVGILDDGSQGELTFAYHEECSFDMEFDVDEIAAGDGCFSYGAPIDKDSTSVLDTRVSAPPHSQSAAVDPDG